MRSATPPDTDRTPADLTEPSRLNLASSVDSAAFQLSPWEILYDTNTGGGFNFGSGAFIVPSAADVTNRAESLLSGLAGPVSPRSIS